MIQKIQIATRNRYRISDSSSFAETRIPIAISILLIVFMILPGCSRTESSALTQVILQTDWFPQPEHGGFYQALANGYYEEEGLEVKILPGGPNAMSTQKVLKGSAYFAMNRADTIYSLVNRDVPVTMVMATLQHDPQAILLHASNPINSFKDLDGQRVMAIPGLNWIKWIEAKYDIELEIIPHDFGIERFLNDSNFIQQCLLTNEPFYVVQAGASPKVLPLRESGFDPYHGIYCLESYADENPETVQRFLRASVKGWRDFILNDPTPALELIKLRNPKMSEEFMDFCYSTMKQQHLVTGIGSVGGEKVGSLDPVRMEALVREMEALGLVEDTGIDMKTWYTTRFLNQPH
ncbi:MAG: ABC transporter substrate-binding protein [Puniceicoccaceae bacterium]